MTPPRASVESSAFHLCKFMTKGKTDWELVSRGAKGTKFSKLQTAFSSTPFLCVLCAPSRQGTRWIISLGIEPQRSQGSQRMECPAAHAVKARLFAPFRGNHVGSLSLEPAAHAGGGGVRVPAGRASPQSRSGAQPQIARAWPALLFVSISVHSWGKSWSQYPVVS